MSSRSFIIVLALLALVCFSAGCQYADYEYMIEVREPPTPPARKKITRLPAQLLITWNGGWRMTSLSDNQVKRITFRQKLGMWPFDDAPSGFNVEVNKEGYQTFMAQYNRQTGVIVLQNDHAFRSDVILLLPLTNPLPSRRITGTPDVPEPATQPATQPATTQTQP
jgi:hypothetical protein